jgi:hypothetical protein
MLMMLSVLIGAQAAHAAPARSLGSGNLPGVLGGSAYAAHLAVLPGSHLLSVAPLYPVGVGCNTKDTTQQAGAATASIPGIGSLGVLSDMITTSHTPTSALVTAESQVAGINLLNGLIVVQAIDIKAQTTADASSSASSNLSSFVGITINGQTINPNVKPNTTINILNLGKLILNEQHGTLSGAGASNISIIGLHLIVGTNTLGLPVGADLRVGVASTSFQRVNIPVLVGPTSATGLRITGNLPDNIKAKSGPYAVASVPCTGGSKTVTVASVNILNIVSTGTLTSSASGTFNGPEADASASSTVQGIGLNLGLLNVLGLSQITALSDSAAATWNNQTSSGTHSTSFTLVGLNLLGQQVTITLPANTQVPVLGIGTLTLNEQHIKTTSSGVQVRVTSLDLLITVNGNPLGLPVGAHIVIGQLEATAQSF